MGAETNEVIKVSMKQVSETGLLMVFDTTGSNT